MISVAAAVTGTEAAKTATATAASPQAAAVQSATQRGEEAAAVSRTVTAATVAAARTRFAAREALVKPGRIAGDRHGIVVLQSGRFRLGVNKRLLTKSEDECDQ